jgi:hypothetical protein
LDKSDIKNIHNEEIILFYDETINPINDGDLEETQAFIGLKGIQA